MGLAYSVYPAHSDEAVQPRPPTPNFSYCLDSETKQTVNHNRTRLHRQKEKKKMHAILIELIEASEFLH